MPEVPEIPQVVYREKCGDFSNSACTVMPPLEKSATPTREIGHFAQLGTECVVDGVFTDQLIVHLLFIGSARLSGSAPHKTADISHPPFHAAISFPTRLPIRLTYGLTVNAISSNHC